MTRHDTAKPEFFSVRQFRDIPLADESGIVLGTKLIQITDQDDLFKAGWDAFGNASIARVAQDGYLLAFQRDVINWPMKMKMSWIGMAELDAAFEQRSEATYINTGHKRPEDPRLFYYNGQLYILYSYVKFQDKQKTTRLELGLLDGQRQLIRRTPLPFALQANEKNWTPFVYVDENCSSLYLIYTFSPRRVLAWTEDEHLDLIIDDASHVQYLKTAWEGKWGEIRGGTPALLIDDQYLCFFHSSIVSNRTRWYVCGAITFSNQPPFDLRSISPYPILFRECYSAPVKPQAFFYNTMKKKNYKVMFPCGFVEGLFAGKPAFFLTSGENESAIRLIIIDKKALFSSLVNIELAEPLNIDPAIVQCGRRWVNWLTGRPKK